MTGFRRTLLLPCLAIIGISSSATLAQTVVINEVVTDPQQDWNDSISGNGIPFDDIPGIEAPATNDEWVEFQNTGSAAIDLTGWTVNCIDGSPATIDFAIAAFMVFSAGGSLTNFLPGEYLVVGDPPGDLNNDVYLVLRDASSAVVDDVEIGDDPEGDGAGDGAPDGLGSDGNATGLADESVARFSDSGDDVADFSKQAATIGESNGPATAIWADPTVATLQGPRIELMGNPAGADKPSIPIVYHVDELSHVRLTVHDVRGRMVALLFEGQRPAGGYGSEWNRGRSASGLYFVHLTTSEISGQTFTRVKKLTLVN